MDFLATAKIHNMDYEDLLQEVNLFWIKAEREFDPGRGLKLHTFAITAVTNDLRNLFYKGGRFRVLSATTYPERAPDLAISDASRLDRYFAFDQIIKNKCGLSDKEQHILIKTLRGDRPPEIAVDMGCSYQNVQNLLNSGIAKLVYTKRSRISG
jgi:RNA polymerase sigma factor (sigma-70 family)